MSRGLVASVLTTVLSLATGCSYGAGAFRCTDDNQCGAGGACEPDNLCSAPSTTCPSGRAYSDLAGAHSGQCIGAVAIDAGDIDAAAAIDASRDAAASDAAVCFGTGLVQLCLAAAPSEGLTISTPTTINTDDAATCAQVISGGDGLCVRAATEIRIDAPVRAVGSKPLVLLATTTITTTALIDAGSHRGATPELGAGADPASCATGTAPGNNGGGAGGSFAGAGGSGGTPNAGTPGAVGPITAVRGGCAGQDGQGAGKGVRGHGGGAVFLLAGSTIDARGGINAAGSSATGALNMQSGGGGGGAGGLIGFDAPTITLGGLILANGGGGGEGSGQNNAGGAGADPTSTAPAAGGKDGSNNGGDGGNGSSGNAAGTGESGKPGNVGSGGGGGGGGGAGVIRVPASATITAAQLSPAPTP